MDNGRTEVQKTKRKERGKGGENGKDGRKQQGLKDEREDGKEKGRK